MGMAVVADGDQRVGGDLAQLRPAHVAGQAEVEDHEVERIRAQGRQRVAAVLHPFDGMARALQGVAHAGADPVAVTSATATDHERAATTDDDRARDRDRGPDDAELEAGLEPGAAPAGASARSAPAWFGRLGVSVRWRRTWATAPAARDRADELWLVATWRR